MTRNRVLVVDDDRDLCLWVEKSLQQLGMAAVWKTSAEQAFAHLSQEDFDVVLTDLRIPGMGGIGLCERVVLNRPDVPVVVMTAHGSMETAISSIRAGAYDFLPKPIDQAALGLVMERALRHRALTKEVRRLRHVAGERSPDGMLLGDSPAMRVARELIERVADSDASVLITGESGTGKEVAARELHARSRRKNGPFVALNCAAMPESLLENELFGHSGGSSTDAKASHPGLFARANGGTLFLDEIGELPLGLQPKLLRALQERKVRPLGSDVEVPFDARIICATNRNLESAVKAVEFREDLYFRINVIGVELPPLRARGNDVLLLAQRFVEHFAAQSGKNVTGLSTGVAQRLLAHDWPGNVRELQNCIERAVALTAFEQLTVEDLPEKLRSYRTAQALAATTDITDLVTMDELERRYILQVLHLVGGSRVVAARTLGVDRKTLYRKLERYRQQEGGGSNPRAA
jgi:DNA-binding NtrC family response regulator